jgi:hypothetical protein
VSPWSVGCFRVWLSADPVLLVIGLARRLGCGRYCLGRGPADFGRPGLDVGQNRWPRRVLRQACCWGCRVAAARSPCTGRRRRPGCGESAEAGAAVGRVFPGTGQPGDNRGTAAADDQGRTRGTPRTMARCQEVQLRGLRRSRLRYCDVHLATGGRLPQLARALAASILLACVTR